MEGVSSLAFLRSFHFLRCFSTRCRWWAKNNPEVLGDLLQFLQFLPRYWLQLWRLAYRWFFLDDQENLPIFWTCSTRRMGEFLGLGLDSPESTGKYQKPFKHVGSTKSNQKFYRFLKVPSEVGKNAEKSHSQVWPDLRRQGRRGGWDDSHASTPSSGQKVMNQQIKLFPSFHVQ